MAFPLIAAGVAAAASWFLSGCGGDDPIGPSSDDDGATVAGDPCAGVDCSGHGACVPMKDEFVCVCERGYYQDGPECLVDTADEGGTMPDADEEVVGDEIEAGGDADAFIDPNQEFPYCDEQKCLNDRSYECKYTEVSDNKIVIGTRVVECNAEQVCRDGKCVTHPDLVDKDCGDGKRLACEVTDAFDVIEDGTSHEFAGTCGFPGAYRNCNYTREAYQCGLDKAYELIGILDLDNDQPQRTAYASMMMMVNVPPHASKYLVDLKFDWYYSHNEGVNYDDDIPGIAQCAEAIKNPELSIQFGDDQRTIVPYSNTWERCVLRTMAAFSPAGIFSDHVRLQVQNRGMGCYDTSHPYEDIHFNVLALAKARLWSCECVE